MLHVLAGQTQTQDVPVLGVIVHEGDVQVVGTDMPNTDLGEQFMNEEYEDEMAKWYENIL